MGGGLRHRADPRRRRPALYRRADRGLSAEGDDAGVARFAEIARRSEKLLATWPAQKISKGSEVERKSVSGQTLTGLGGY